MNELVPIRTAAAVLGVSTSTLRRWEAKGRLRPARTDGRQRRYDLAALLDQFQYGATAPRKTVAYARVSSHGQKQDLERQVQVLELYCKEHGWRYEVIADLGSGMNYHKEGLSKLLDQIVSDELGRLVITHQDRLLRFGAELVFALCQAKGVEVVIINQDEDRTFEEDLASDVLEIVTVYSARLYSSRSQTNQRLIDAMRQSAKDTSCS